jgi:hypothetical protein
MEIIGLINGLILLLTLFCCFIDPTISRTPYPLGVNLGSTYITAAYFTAEDQPVTVASVKGTEVYRAYMTDTLENEGKRILSRGEWWVLEGESLILAPPESHDSVKTKYLFVEALSSVKSAAETALGFEVNIGVISEPQQFNGTSTTCVIDAAMEIDATLKRPEQIRPFVNIANLAYGPNSCVDLDFGNWSDYDDEDTQITILIDYSADNIDIAVADITAWGVSRRGRWSLSLPERDEIRDSTAGKYEGFKQALQELVAEYLPTTPSFDYRQHFHAIILSGEASPEAMSEIREAITSAIPNLQDKLQDSIEPLYVGAVGAACWARQQVLHPALLQDIDLGTIIPDEDESHDEL